MFFHAAKCIRFFMRQSVSVFHAAKIRCFSCSKVYLFFMRQSVCVFSCGENHTLPAEFLTGKVNEIDMKKIINFASLISYLFSYLSFIFTSRLFLGMCVEKREPKKYLYYSFKNSLRSFFQKYKFFRVRSSTH